MCVLQSTGNSQEEDNERSMAIASALVTFFKQVGFESAKASHSIDKCPYFNARDKSKLLAKFSSKNAKKVSRFISIYNLLTIDQMKNACCLNRLLNVTPRGIVCSFGMRLKRYV